MSSSIVKNLLVGRDESGLGFRAKDPKVRTLGATMALERPFRFDELVAAIRRVLDPAR